MRLKAGIFQANDDRGFSKVKKLLWASNNLHMNNVRWYISLPFLSLSSLFSPSGFCELRVPPFKFCRRLNEAQGNPKCQICLPPFASIHNAPKTSLSRISNKGLGRSLCINSKGASRINLLRLRKMAERWAEPAKISLNFQCLMAGCSSSGLLCDSFVCFSCVPERRSQPFAASEGRSTVSSPKSQINCSGSSFTALQIFLFDLRFRMTPSLSPKISRVIWLGYGEGSGILLNLEG